MSQTTGRENTIPHQVYIFHGQDDEQVNNGDVPSVVVEESVRDISDWAFQGHRQLQQIKFPSNLRSIGYGAFSGCVSLTVILFPNVLETISNYAFDGCTSLTTLYFSASLKRIGTHAFTRCTSLVVTNKLPTKEVPQIDELAFAYCLTLELRQRQHQTTTETYNNHSQPQERSIETIQWIKQRYGKLPIHEICSNPNITLHQLKQTTHQNKQTLQQTDELGMTALHILCLNPNATSEMLQLLVKLHPGASTTEMEIVTNSHYSHLHACEVPGMTHQKMTPIKLWLKMKHIVCDSNEAFLDRHGHIKFSTALQKGVHWNDLPIIMYIQSSFPDSEERGQELGLNKQTNFYRFMEAAALDGISRGAGTCQMYDMVSLETVYHLASYDATLIYLYFGEERNLPPKKKRRKY